jgi:hypothetical protein
MLGCENTVKFCRTLAVEYLLGPMPHPFKSYEVEVLKLLLAQEFSEDVFVQLLEGASAPHVEYTNYGFYVSIEHSAIGKARRVCSGTTTLSGRFGCQSAGFVAFLEDDKLTLEIFPWNGEALPATFRDADVQVVHEVRNEKV